MEKSKPSESTTAQPLSGMPIPEVVVEKVGEEPRQGDNFDPNATIGQKDAHEMRALDAEPDHVVIRSEQHTSICKDCC